MLEANEYLKINECILHVYFLFIFVNPSILKCNKKCLVNQALSVSLFTDVNVWKSTYVINLSITLMIMVLFPIWIGPYQTCVSEEEVETLFDVFLKVFEKVTFWRKGGTC